VVGLTESQDLNAPLLEEVIGDHDKENEIRLKDELRRVKPSFWVGVWSSVIGSFIFILLLGILVFFSWSLKQGPRQAIELIFNVKISPAETGPKMPSPTPPER
jgi:ATP-dependent Zn protease